MVDPPNNLSPLNNPVTLYTGESNDDYVHWVMEWNGSMYPNVPMTTYNGTKSTDTTYVSPWMEQMMLMGSDGSQFEAGVDEDDTLYYFVNTL